MLHYGGEKWTKWNAVMRDQLVSTQKPMVTLLEAGI